MSLFAKLYTLVAVVVVAFLIYCFSGMSEIINTKLQNAEKTQTEKHIEPVSTIDKILGGVVGLGVMWLIVGYGLMKGKNEAKDEQLQDNEKKHAEALCQKDKTIEQLQLRLPTTNKRKSYSLFRRWQRSQNRLSTNRSWRWQTSLSLIPQTKNGSRLLLLLSNTCLPSGPYY